MDDRYLPHPHPDLLACIVGLTAAIAAASAVSYGADLLVNLWGVLSV